MFTIFMLICGLFWTLTYLLIIRRDMLDKTYGMPFVALCANISWEGIFSFIYPPGPIQHVVNLVWFFLDVIIFLQLLRYGPHEFPDLPRPVFDIMVGVALIMSFGIFLGAVIELNDRVYGAFWSNLMMSILFILMLYQRHSLRGQSLSIAMSKMIGTLFASLAFCLYSLYSQSILLWFLAVFCLLFDAIYVGMVIILQKGGSALAQELWRDEATLQKEENRIMQKVQKTDPSMKRQGNDDKL